MWLKKSEFPRSTVLVYAIAGLGAMEAKFWTYLKHGMQLLYLDTVELGNIHVDLTKTQD